MCPSTSKGWGWSLQDLTVATEKWASFRFIIERVIRRDQSQIPDDHNFKRVMPGLNVTLIYVILQISIFISVNLSLEMIWASLFQNSDVCSST